MVHELVRVQVAVVRQKVGQHAVGRDVERHAQSHIPAALIQRARQSGAVRDVELHEHVARRQRHFMQLARVPRRNQNTARRALLGIL